MITHKMHLHTEPFESIVKGIKTIEIRLYDEKRKNITVGDSIQFIKKTNPHETITVFVLELITCRSFKELFHTIDHKQLCNFKLTSQQFTNNMYKYYSPEEEKKYGVLGIIIQKINP